MKSPPVALGLTSLLMDLESKSQTLLALMKLTPMDLITMNSVPTDLDLINPTSLAHQMRKTLTLLLPVMAGKVLPLSGSLDQIAAPMPLASKSIPPEVLLLQVHHHRLV
jgi:hypothetical protein